MNFILIVFKGCGILWKECFGFRSDKGITLLSQLLRESGYNQITNTKSGNDARRCINQTEYELIVINTPLTDEFGHEFSIKAAECSNSGIHTYL